MYVSIALSKFIRRFAFVLVGGLVIGLVIFLFFNWFTSVDVHIF